MPVLPELGPMLARINEARARLPDTSAPLADRRAVIHRGMDHQAAAASRPAPATTITDHEVKVDGGAITVRSYRPDLTGELPCHVYVHGGGWWLGELRHRDAVCGYRAASVECVVVSVGYRLAPEHPFPTPVDDCYAALRWTNDNADRLQIDASRMSIGGDSSGANLAAATTLMARNHGGSPLLAQVLEIPVLDLTMSQPSVNEVTEGVPLTRSDLADQIDLYCAPEDRRNPYASPLLADDLTGLPPALIMTAEYDILRDDGEAYGRRLTQAGVSADVVQWAGHIHGSHVMTAMLESAREWQTQVAGFLRGKLNP
jgi:acetyl esterase